MEEGGGSCKQATSVNIEGGSRCEIAQHHETPCDDLRAVDTTEGIGKVELWIGSMPPLLRPLILGSALAPLPLAPFSPPAQHGLFSSTASCAPSCPPHFLLSQPSVRHGETVDNRRRIIAGHNQTGLTQTGKLQALTVAKSLALVHPHFDEIHCSDLKRARETAEIILSELPGDWIQISHTQMLREKGAGALMGKPIGNKIPCVCHSSKKLRHPSYFLLCIADSLSNTTARSSNDKASIQ